MNILFITLVDIRDVKLPGIYTDLIREMSIQGNEVTCLSPLERRFWNDDISLNEEKNVVLEKVKIGNITKTNLVEKGLTTSTLDFMFKKAVKRLMEKSNYDLVIYTTPPVTLVHTIQYIKRNSNAKTFLLLKDIFPQNAIDLNYFSENSVFHKYYKRKEKNLYKNSDYIGCMTENNKSYLLEHNSYIDESKVTIIPNSVYIKGLIQISKSEEVKIREEYGLPIDKSIYVYGGNLGKPQGLSFFINSLQNEKYNNDIVFLVIGAGTEFARLKKIEENMCGKLIVLENIPAEKFEQLLTACDVGLIFLDYRFTIPNYPSRLLSYLKAGLPVIAATDKATDLMEIIPDNKLGEWIESSPNENLSVVINKFNKLPKVDKQLIGKNGYEFFAREYDVKKSCQDIFEIID